MSSYIAACRVVAVDVRVPSGSCFVRTVLRGGRWCDPVHFVIALRISPVPTVLNLYLGIFVVDCTRLSDQQVIQMMSKVVVIFKF